MNNIQPGLEFIQFRSESGVSRNDRIVFGTTALGNSSVELINLALELGIVLKNGIGIGSILLDSPVQVFISDFDIGFNKFPSFDWNCDIGVDEDVSLVGIDMFSWGCLGGFHWN